MADIGDLMKMARAGETTQRREAIKGLACVEAPDSLSILQAMGATDPDRQIRLEATRAARELRTRLSTGSMSAASQTGTGPPALAQRLQSEEPTERAKAIFGCLRYDSDRVLTAILELLDRERTPKVRAMAMAALGVLGSSSETAKVKSFLDDPDHKVREAADEAMVKLSELEYATLSSPAIATPPPPVPDPPAPPSPAPKVLAVPGPPTPPASTPAPPVPPVASAPRPPAIPAPTRLPPTPAPPSARPSPTGALRTGGLSLNPSRSGTSPGLSGARSTPSSFSSGLIKKPGFKSPFGKTKTEATASRLDDPPFADKMNPEERAKLDKLLKALSGGILSTVEKSRIAERGFKCYELVLKRLQLPEASVQIGRALFFMAANDRAMAAAELKKCPRDAVMAPHIEPLLIRALSEEEITVIRETKEEVVAEATGQDRFPPEVFQLVYGTIRRGKAMMGELDTPQRSKLKIKLDQLSRLLEAGDVEEGRDAALVLKRDITRLTNALNEKSGRK